MGEKNARFRIDEISNSHLNDENYLLSTLKA